MHQGPYTIVQVGFLKECKNSPAEENSSTEKDMATVLGYKRDAIRVKVIVSIPTSLIRETFYFYFVTQINYIPQIKLLSYDQGDYMYVMFFLCVVPRQRNWGGEAF